LDNDICQSVPWDDGENNLMIGQSAGLFVTCGVSNVGFGDDQFCIMRAAIHEYFSDWLVFDE
jgi:hypothetical protein